MTSRATPSTARPDGSGPPSRTAAESAVDRGALRPRDQLVDVEVTSAGLAHEQRPGHVASIAGHLRSKVEEQDSAGHDRSVARSPVGQRRLGSGEAGDIEGELLGPTRSDRPFES